MDHAPPVVTCASCRACCCRLEVLLMPEDDVPEAFVVQDPWEPWTMARREDGWCAALDRTTMLCTIYERRPAVCRDFETGGDDCIGQRRLGGVWVPGGATGDP